MGFVDVENPTVVNSSKLVGSCFCLLPCGDEVVVAHNFVISHWKLFDDHCLRSMRGHTMPILSIASNSSGTLIVSGSADGFVKVWDLFRGYCTHSFKDNWGVIQSVKFHPNHEVFVVFAVCGDNSIVKCDLRTKQIAQRVHPHTSSPSNFDFHLSSNTMVTAGTDKVLVSYNLLFFQILGRFCAFLI